ncbi:MAG: phosphate ABC transporter substrate-binding protein [Alphaproteobacteria bacterium]
MAVLFGAILGVLQPASAMGDDLTWVGCGVSKKAFMSALAKAYEAKTGVGISLSGGGATRGIRAPAAGESDMGGSCRHLIDAPEEKNARLVPVGWDALVAITHPSNPIRDISLAQLTSVFTGIIVNWRDLGGPDKPIKVVVREGKISGVGRMARELIFKDPDEDYPPAVTTLPESGPIEELIEQDETAIALTGISSSRKRTLNLLSVDGVAPTYENVASGSYPFFRPLYLVTSKTPSDKVKDFIKFATRDEGQDIIRSEGTVTLKDGSRLWPKYRESMKEARQIGNY